MIMMAVFGCVTGVIDVQDNAVLIRSKRLLLRRCLTEKEASAYIGMSRSFLRQSRMNGKRHNRTPGPPFIKIGRRIHYLEHDLDAWLDENRHVD